MSPAVAVRAACFEDAPALARLIDMLGYPVTEADVDHRLAALAGTGLTPLVAEREGHVVACLTLSVMTVLHRPHPVGRISMLVVDEQWRGGGIGALLVTAAEACLREKGCGLVEVTSNARRTRPCLLRAARLRTHQSPVRQGALIAASDLNPAPGCAFVRADNREDPP